MHVSLLTPEAALLAVGALVPVVLLLDGEKRAAIVPARSVSRARFAPR